jgi:hypothetical protein
MTVTGYTDTDSHRIHRHWQLQDTQTLTVTGYTDTDSYRIHRHWHLQDRQTLTITNTHWSNMYKEIIDIHSDNGNMSGYTSIPLHTYLHDVCRCNFTFIFTSTTIVGNAQAHWRNGLCAVDGTYSYHWTKGLMLSHQNKASQVQLQDTVLRKLSNGESDIKMGSGYLPMQSALYTQLNWVILLCDVIPNGKTE